MKFKNTPKGKEQLDKFLLCVDKAKGAVLLRSPDGDEFNLKSVFSKYIGIGHLLDDHGDYLELFCMDKSDENLFFEFFNNNSDVM